MSIRRVREEVADRMGRWTTFTLDSMGDPILTTNALGGTVAAGFNLDGEQTRTRDERGFNWSQVVNNMGELTSGTVARVSFQLRRQRSP